MWQIERLPAMKRKNKHKYAPKPFGFGAYLHIDIYPHINITILCDSDPAIGKSII